MGTLYKEIYNAIKDVIEDNNELHSIIIMIMKYIYKTDVVQDITTDREYNCPISENDVIESELYLNHSHFN